MGRDTRECDTNDSVANCHRLDKFGQVAEKATSVLRIGKSVFDTKSHTVSDLVVGFTGPFEEFFNACVGYLYEGWEECLNVLAQSLVSNFPHELGPRLDRFSIYLRVLS